MDLDTRLIVLMLWGGGAVATYALVLVGSWRRWRTHHDVRAGRDVMEDFGLFLTAVAAAGAVFLVLFGSVGAGIRGFFVALALGSFVGVGFVKATDNGPIAVWIDKLERRLRR